mmetsp:Transcript_39990/g.119101  ORF Transcript_39990/g.119101 Transcript_39990/m.119101 type:complete len:115 (+) Transcript_39990:926-1270(+)|eukprot:364533-Chlamydomonas_euryale.AAC.10
MLAVSGCISACVRHGAAALRRDEPRPTTEGKKLLAALAPAAAVADDADDVDGCPGLVKPRARRALRWPQQPQRVDISPARQRTRILLDCAETAAGSGRVAAGRCVPTRLDVMHR